MSSDQFSFLPAQPHQPEGLEYRTGFVSEAEEHALVEQFDRLIFREFEFHGFLGKRRTISFGWHYAFDGRGLRKTEEIPEWLRPARDRAAELAGLPADAFEHALLLEYGEGAGIGWHKDRPVFGDVVGISLLAPARLRFRRKRGDKWERFTITAEPRSAYLLRGPARSEWEHSIPGVDALRYSITFRSLREGGTPQL